jgi:hypothetical protein
MRVMTLLILWSLFVFWIIFCLVLLIGCGGGDPSVDGTCATAREREDALIAIIRAQQSGNAVEQLNAQVRYQALPIESCTP